ncbi:tRNA pseudouridine(13) synthase TruD [Candidatus Uhrbacteria bacterium]|nr:tRNA pseudouridine(13) synthase TruD [Candidatus Uhrbacteria bacterium]
MREDVTALTLRERATIEAAREATPELFHRPPVIDGPDELRQAGVELPNWPDTVGYMRFYPHDFIVEEIQSDGKTISTVEPSEATLGESGEVQKTVYADLVKAGIPTPEAKNRLAAALGIEVRFIGTAGIQDAPALTAQRVSFRDASIEKLKNLKLPNLFLTRLTHGKGATQVGELAGNRFTIVLRTEKEVGVSALEGRVAQLEREGFFNFYGLQRFGTRLRSHWFGLLLLRGDYQKAIESFLFDPGPRDLPFFKSLRERAKTHAPNWRMVREVYEACPYTLQYERRVLSALEGGASPDRAIAGIEDQMKLWVYAYMSFLNNRLLSRGAHGEALPQEIPIPLSDRSGDRSLYRTWLDADGVHEEAFKRLVRTFPFIRLTHRTLASRITVSDVHIAACPPGVATTFKLPRGAYATTFLMNLFLLSWGQPVPAWIQPEEVDAKKLFGTGTIEGARTYLGEYMKHIGAHRDDEAEPSE